MAKVLINGRALPYQSISTRQSLGAIGSASIVFPFSFYPKYMARVEVYDDYDFPIFRGYIAKVKHEKSARTFKTSITAYDPLYLLKLRPFTGGYSGTLQDLVMWLAEDIGVIPAIQSDATVNVYYDNQKTKYDLLADACHFAGISFYYDPFTNELRESGGAYADNITITAFSWSKRVHLRISESTDIVNVVKVTNVRE